MQGRNESDLVDTFAEYNTDPVEDPEPKLAIFTFKPRRSINAQMDICLVGPEAHTSCLPCALDAPAWKQQFSQDIGQCHCH